MITHRLPSKVFESNLPRLLDGFAGMDAGEEPLVLDFRHVEYWIPAAIVFACAMANCWRERGRSVSFLHVGECRAFGYLQRMDFFERVGLKIPEHFNRHDPGTSFVEIQEVFPGPARMKDPVATSLAVCLAGTENRLNDALRFSEYAVGEVVANCQQHAMKPGFAAAQYAARTDSVRIGVADYGIGIRESFRLAVSPHYREGMTDPEALELAMRPWVSSKNHLRTGSYGESPNRGIGLKMIRHMVSDSFGELFISSGRAWTHFRNSGCTTGVLSHDRRVPGTLVSIRFDRGNVGDFQGMLQAAQAAVGLTTEDAEAMFGP